MKKTLLFFSTILVLTAYSFAQISSSGTKIIWSKKAKFSKKMSFGGFVAEMNGNTFTVQKEIEKSGEIFDFIITKYNDQMVPIAESEIKLKDEHGKRSLEGLIQSANKIYLFSSFLDKKLKKNILYVQTLNTQTLIPNKDKKKLCDIRISGKSKKKSGGFMILKSENDKYIFVNAYPPAKSDIKIDGEYLMYNSDLDLQYQTKIKPTSPNGGIERLYVGNKGNIYSLEHIYSKSSSYKVVAYKEKGQNIIEYPIELKDKSIKSMLMELTPDEDIMCAGLYYVDDINRVIGTFYLKVNNETENVEFSNTKAFDNKFITDGYSKKQTKKELKRAQKGKEIGLYNYKLRNLVVNRDGSINLIGEQFHIETTTTYNANGGMSVSYTYYYNNILLVQINPEGKIENNIKIKKAQYAVANRTSTLSFLSFKNDDKIYFLFNDNPKNIRTPGPEYNISYYSGGKRSVAIMLDVDNNGNIKSTSLFKGKEADLVLIPLLCSVSKDKTAIFLYAMDGKKGAIGKMKLK